MVDLATWLKNFTDKLMEAFDDRIEFLGLQGSYARNEATEESDIDLVVILDKLEFQDIYQYDKVLNDLPHREKICGFISGKQELINWEPSDLFHLYFDTVPLKGNLDFLIDRLKPEDINRAIHIGACNCYHMSVHNLLHARQKDTLKELYKTSCFVIQTEYYRKTGIYYKHLAELLDVVDAQEKKIIVARQRMKKGEELDFNLYSELLITWAKGMIL